MPEVVQRLSKQRSVEVNLFCLNGFDMNHIIYSCEEKNDRHMLCQERHEISLTGPVLLVNCHDVTGRIFDQWISRQTVMKSPLKWHNQPGEKKRTFRKSILTLTTVYEAFTSFNWLLSCQILHGCNANQNGVETKKSSQEKFNDQSTNVQSVLFDSSNAAVTFAPFAILG